MLKNKKFDRATDDHEYDWNNAIDMICDDFECFSLPPEQFGAFAYVVEDNEVVHIGKIPDEN